MRNNHVMPGDSGFLCTVRPWVIAARPKTLPAALCPIGFAAAVALREGGVRWWLLGVVCLCAVLIQVICNYANDLYDFVKGADTENRVGPQRAVQSGLISPEAMRRMLGYLVILSLVLGGILVLQGGWKIAAIGIASLVAAFAYTSGPLPLAYWGLGEPFVLVFFGPVPVYGTLLILTGRCSVSALAASIGISGLATALLVVNNIRDRAQDEVARKHTISVRLGESRCRYEYAGWIAVSLFMPLISWWIGAPLGVLLGMGTLPMGVRIARLVFEARDADRFGQALQKTVLLLVGYSVAVSVGWLL